MNGKGSSRRPSQVSAKQVAENWERTFGDEWARHYRRQPYIETSGADLFRATAPQAKRTSHQRPQRKPATAPR